MRLLTFAGPYPVVATIASPTVDPAPPEPGGSAPTLPDGVPASGTLTYDSSPTGEGTASGTLPFAPQFTLPVSLSFVPGDHHELGLGYSADYGRSTVTREGVDMHWSLDATDKATLKAFFDARRRSPWTWVAVDGSVTAWALVSDVRYSSAGRNWRIRASVVEIK